jgi:hypothetical protein
MIASDVDLRQDLYVTKMCEQNAYCEKVFLFKCNKLHMALVPILVSNLTDSLS